MIGKESGELLVEEPLGGDHHRPAALCVAGYAVVVRVGVAARRGDVVVAVGAAGCVLLMLVLVLVMLLVLLLLLLRVVEEG